jgi:hypothetical protein
MPRARLHPPEFRIEPMRLLRSTLTPFIDRTFHAEYRGSESRLPLEGGIGRRPPNAPLPRVL